MKRIERILLASNLSPHSDRAMERALLLAQAHDADLSVVHALPLDVSEATSAADRLDPADARREILRHLAAFGGAAGKPAFVHCKQGKIADVVADFANSWQPDLKVVGIRRKEALADLLLPSTVENLTTIDDIPLLAVRNKPFGPYCSALVAVDFSPLSRKVLEAALVLVPEGHVTLAHVCDLPGMAASAHPGSEADFEDEFRELLAGISLDGRSLGRRVVQGGTVSSLVALAEAEPHDLVVMGTEGRGFVGRLLVGSVAHQALEQMGSDILLVKSGP